MTDDEQQDEQTDEAYEEPEVEDLKSEDGPAATAAGASNGQAPG
ncbi:MAG: hypothetical protein QOG29_2045 [Gaiellaceae bacterium]|jgi:hypothetical protein|nr:hypothetical protein [Gaiellaceae bacterium]MDX6479458.1 hypothetical protein [Gaiellaceae bacterium]MDX6492575.1 hypothetical protein [Gaiellaceae bacterium]